MSRISLPTPQNVTWFETAHNDTNEVFAQLYQFVPWLDGQLFEVGDADNAVTAGLQTIQHNLGRPVKGFLLVDVVSASASTVTSGVFRRAGDTNDENVFQLFTETNVAYLKVWLW